MKKIESMTLGLKEVLKGFMPLYILYRAIKWAIKDYETIRREKIGEQVKKFEIRTFKKDFEDYFSTHNLKKLQVGSGNNPLIGWWNTDLYSSKDIYFLDATVLFPFPNNSFDYVFSEHMIEHLSYKDGLFMLKEIFRVLKVSGKLRISTPDIDKIIKLHTGQKTKEQERYLKWCMEEVLGLYSPEESELQKRYPWWAIDYNHFRRAFPNFRDDSFCFVINNFFRSWGHKFLYDYRTLAGALTDLGFKELRRYSPGESNDHNLKGIESHHKVIGEENNNFETMVIEAVKNQNRKANQCQGL
jgi:SAM-dependent methyltransferase